jgi:hypothetical protein
VIETWALADVRYTTMRLTSQSDMLSGRVYFVLYTWMQYLQNYMEKTHSDFAATNYINYTNYMKNKLLIIDNNVM